MVEVDFETDTVPSSLNARVDLDASISLIARDEGIAVRSMNERDRSDFLEI